MSIYVSPNGEDIRERKGDQNPQGEI